MEGKNVLLAIVLSTIVLVFWATFFEPPVIEREILENEITKENEIIKNENNQLKIEKLVTVTDQKIQTKNYEEIIEKYKNDCK